MKYKTPRCAVRALILNEDRVLLVNAYPGKKSNLWCAPGGGVVPGQSLPENLIRELFEETGLTIDVGTPALINEFHDPISGFHQIEVFFHCSIVAGRIDPNWQDPGHIVTRRRFFSRSELATTRYKPSTLAKAAWGQACIYDALENVIL
ncbi:MAG: 8-oxo-dGTP diphosphatase [Paracoccaceae bacterium]|jgi:8-oxo-dGTP diphosphatase